MVSIRNHAPGYRRLNLRNDNALLRNVVENAVVPTFVATIEGKVVYSNRAFAELLGYDPEELVGMGYKHIVHPVDADLAQEQTSDLMWGNTTSYRAERRYLRKNGESIWVLASAAALVDETTGASRHVTVQAIDIDRQKRAEEKLAENESRWNSALEAAGQGVWEHDLVKERVFYSRMWRLMRGIGADEEVDGSAESWLSRVHPDDRERILSIIRLQDSGEIPYNAFEYRERHRGGYYVWILSRGGPVAWFPDGRPSRVIGTDTDITSLKQTEEKLKFANTLLMKQMETSPDGILVVDANARIISYNHRFSDMWGVSRVSIQDGPDAPVLAAVELAMADPVAFAERVSHYYAHPDTEGNDELRTKDGRVIIRHTGPLRSSDNQYLGRIWFFRDITEKIRTSEERELQNIRFEAAINNMTQGLCMFDHKDRLVVSNKPYATMYKLSPEKVLPGLLLDDLLRQRAEAGNHPIGGANAYVSNRLAIAKKEEPAHFIVELTDGRVISIRHEPLPDGGWVATHEDVTEQRRNQERVLHLAKHDVLTDLPNRALFQEHLKEVNFRIKQGEILSVLGVDLDGFKGVNDTLGHSIGDALLKRVSQRLRETVRDADMVARIGGDEFAIIEGRLARQQDAAALASRIVKGLAEPFDVEGHHIIIGASVGIAVAPLDGLDGDTLLKNADLALYRAKHSGRSTYHFYEKGLDAALQERRTMEAALRSALSNSELRLVFQPLLNLRDNRLCAFEALLRWEHPANGYMLPRQFIPVAEESGLIIPIGAWVLCEACLAAASWPGELGVAVNVSPVQFRKNHSLVDDVKSALSISGLRPERLELEITESVFMADNEYALTILRELKALGIKVAMDDFGAGYSSLSYLRRFPFDKIKIDQSFVQESSTDADSLAIVKAVISLGHSLGMTTTAEGVETEAQLSMIREQGCTEVQGFLFSAPLPPNAVKELLARVATPATTTAMRSEHHG